MPNWPRAWQQQLLAEGVYVIGFSFPVVPKGKARIRTQMSAAHTPEQIDRAVAAFAKVGRQLGAICNQLAKLNNESSLKT